MEAAKLHNEIIKGYAASTTHEWERLTLSNGIMEYITTIYYLEKYLPKNGVVADIGSGPGRYSIWLAQHGYDVVSVDTVEKSIKSLKARFAASKQSEWGIELLTTIYLQACLCICKALYRKRKAAQLFLHSGLASQLCHRLLKQHRLLKLS
ncbi:MAG: class I SAM-dependent methyltransferase [Candidatus Parvarchaeota archaeon]|nr:class I SAM-dependent methyltransferase [Candidatus Parvarchaeum tengchongense]